MSDARSTAAIAGDRDQDLSGVEHIRPGVEAPARENPGTAARVADINKRIESQREYERAVREGRLKPGAPSVVMNPQAHPTRMTPSQLVERVTAAQAALDGEMPQPTPSGDPTIGISATHADQAAAAIDHEMRTAGMARAGTTVDGGSTGGNDSRISTRAKQRLMGDEDMGQYLFRSTGTMLPKKQAHLMEPLLKLFGRGIIIIDVFTGGERCALAFLAPLGQLGTAVNGGSCARHAPSIWTPGDHWVQQTATHILEGKDKGAVQVELLARDDIGTQDEWRLGKNRVHRLNEYPRRHLEPMSRIAGSTAAFELMWRTMGLVFIWEREAKDDLEALVRHLAQCSRA